MLLKMDFHDSTCDSNFRTNEQIDRPIRDDVKTALGAKEEEPAEPDASTGE